MHGVVFKVIAPAIPHATKLGGKLPITPVRDPEFLEDNHSNTIDFKVSEF